MTNPPVPSTPVKSSPYGFPIGFPIWPAHARPASPRILVSAAAAGLLAASVPLFPHGLNVLIIGLTPMVALAPVARRNRTSVAFGLLALALLVLPLLRDAGWLVALSICLAVPLGSYALTGGRSWADLLGGGIALPLAVPDTLPWVGQGVVAMSQTRRRPSWPLLRSILIAAGLVVVFGLLFAQADAAFSRVVTALIPTVDLSLGPVLLHLLVFAIAAGVVLTGAFAASARPRFRDLAPAPADPAGRIAWAIPIAALDLLFFGFAVVQADVLLSSDKGRLLGATGLTYAEYARQGFWQLLIVTGLVLAVVAFAVRYAPLRNGRDRALVRALLGLLCALTLLVVAVALRRLYLYEEAYGWTRLRIWVHAFELWMGLVVVLIAIAGIRLKAAWLPRAVAVSGATGLLALGLLNPDGFIASRNVDHYRHTGKADLSYLAGLSADAVPAIDRLPEPARSCTLRHLADELHRTEPWTSANLARDHARTLLARYPVQPTLTC